MTGKLTACSRILSNSKHRLTPPLTSRYQNEHGPNRLRLPFCKNGFRYRATDLESKSGSQEKPEWMAIYDFDELEHLTREPYLKLRSAPVQTQRERDTMKQIFVDRRNYDLLGEWKGSDFKDLQKVENEGEKNVMIAVSFQLQDGKDKEEELEKWYNEEHVPLLQKVPGWRRTRRFVTSYLDLESGHRKEKEFLALHEYAQTLSKNVREGSTTCTILSALRSATSRVLRATTRSQQKQPMVLQRHSQHIQLKRSAPSSQVSSRLQMAYSFPTASKAPLTPTPPYSSS
jgi:hypothetical protein